VSEAIEKAAKLVDAAKGTTWYGNGASQIDIAVSRLCRLRRVRAAYARDSDGGDEAARAALEAADPAAVVWLASRTISFMDEHGFPELVPEPAGVEDGIEPPF
jgi:hypothetical protein